MKPIVAMSYKPARYAFTLRTFGGIDGQSDAVKTSWWDFHTVERHLRSGVVAAHLPPGR
jgi:hypothetical protein